MNILKTNLRFIVQSLVFLAFLTFNSYCGGGGCSCESTPAPPADLVISQNEVAIRFKPISFVGDFTPYVSADLLRLTAEENPGNFDTPIAIDRAITWTGNSPSVAAPGNAVYVLNSNQANPATSEFPLLVNTDLIQTSGNILLQNVNTVRNLQHARLSDISITVNVTSTPVLDIVVDTSQNNIVSNAYNYNVNCTAVHGSLGSQDSRMNIAVMAEGYRADQMNDYIAYTADAFATPENFHYTESGATHYVNDFFARHWGDINVVRYDTVSPEEGVDTTSNTDTVKSILDYNHSTGEASMLRIKAVLERSNNSGKCGLSLANVDTVILLINSPSTYVNAHTWAYGNEMFYRRGEQVTYNIVHASAGQNPAVANFHLNSIWENRVRTDAIAHELGHSLARLQDEYMINNSGQTCQRAYRDEFRNISNNNTKWAWFVNNYGTAVNYPVDYFLGGLYCPNTFFRSNEVNTMRGVAGVIPAIGLQFGPLNSFYMYGTLQRRIGVGPADPDGLLSDILMIQGIWSNEYVAWVRTNFLADWPISDF